MMTTQGQLLTPVSVQNIPTAPVASAAPVRWIIGWLVYSLLALAYFGYQSAWLGSLCITR